ncbi:MAG: rubrerythrin [Bacteroidetes bacterium]|nr:MAG: rubrerythrin [Bacteroidota bacterium]
MNKETFNDIIKFAIERELEAANFYKDMANKTKFEANIILFLELEKMEMGHAETLKKFKNEGWDKLDLPNIPDLKISDYMETPDVKEGMTYQDAIILAMKREKASTKLYTDLAKEFTDMEAKNLFIRLANEETNHKFQLESLYDEEILTEN